MASKVGKAELACDIWEAKKIKCFEGENNLLCQILYLWRQRNSSQNTNPRKWQHRQQNGFSLEVTPVDLKMS